MNRVLKASLRPVRNLALTIGFNVIGCAALFLVIEHGTQLRERDLDIGFMGSLYWAVTTATTTGYGDISPLTFGGRLLGMWLMLTSVGLVAVATATIASSLVQDPHLFSKEEQQEVADDNDDQIAMLCLLLEHHDIPVPEGVEEYHNKEGSKHE